MTKEVEAVYEDIFISYITIMTTFNNRDEDMEDNLDINNAFTDYL